MASDEHRPTGTATFQFIWDEKSHPTMLSYITESNCHDSEMCNNLLTKQTAKRVLFE